MSGPEVDSAIGDEKEVAKQKGFDVVYPSDDELFIDIDSEVDHEHFIKSIGYFSLIHPLTWEKKPSPSGAPFHFHITVTLENEVIDDERRMLMQALLGSDRLHELLSYRNARRGDRTPTCFFEKPLDARALEKALKLAVEGLQAIANGKPEAPMFATTVLHNVKAAKEPESEIVF